MIEISFKDLENIKESLSQTLKNYSDSVAEKKHVDSTYLKIYKLYQEIKLYCEATKIEISEIQQMPLSLDYDLNDINNLKAEKENLIFDFN